MKLLSHLTFIFIMKIMKAVQMAGVGTLEHRVFWPHLEKFSFCIIAFKSILLPLRGITSKLL